MEFKLKTYSKKLLADTLTPVSVYLRLRDKFPNSLLLESSDYHANDNSFSYICCNPIASIKIDKETIVEQFPDGSEQRRAISAKTRVPTILQNFAASFSSEKHSPHKFIHNGLFGFMAYDAVRFYENIELAKKGTGLQLPDVYYAVYKNIIAINHFNNEAYIFSHCYNSEENINEIEQLLKAKTFAEFPFQREGNPTSNLDDTQFKKLVTKCKEHCARGDVFQIVPSKRFSQEFSGDEFNVYRALRSINPSPYLFYFDYGNFKIFGSSPEAQLVVSEDRAEIHPIAGTFKRTGNDESDADLARQLSKDDKENSEHVMLVDLARNDLSRHGSDVKVETYREVQFFSHVIHLVSKVTAKLKPNTSTMQIVADTFPASKDHMLHYQAGAGIVSESNEENELQEVYNKLGALTKALQLAENIS